VIVAIALGKIGDGSVKMVVYQALYDCPDLAGEYGIRPIFVRPYADFVQKIDKDGHRRFSKV